MSDGSVIRAAMDDMRVQWTAAERARIVEQLRFLADARKDYCHSCPETAGDYHGMDPMALSVHEEHASAAWLADIIEGTNTGQGWLPSWRWLDWKTLREATSNETPVSVGSSPARANERGVTETIEAVRRLFSHLANGDYDGQVSMGFAATFDQHLDGILEEAVSSYDAHPAEPASVGHFHGETWVSYPRNTCAVAACVAAESPVGVSDEAVEATYAEIEQIMSDPDLGPSAKIDAINELLYSDEAEGDRLAALEAAAPMMGATPVASRERLAEGVEAGAVAIDVAKYFLPGDMDRFVDALLAAGVFREPPTLGDIFEALDEVYKSGAMGGEWSGLGADAVLALMGGAE